jgi:hypothetical protein
MGMRTLFLIVLFASVALADGASDHVKLTGTWQPVEGTDGVTWTLENTSNAVKITQSQNGQKVSEFECNVAGKECEISDNGHKAKVSMWFNGAKLVELETRGSEVVKRVFSVVQPDDFLEVEVIPVVPGGKTETLRFHRAQLTAAGR